MSALCTTLMTMSIVIKKAPPWLGPPTGKFFENQRCRLAKTSLFFTYFHKFIMKYDLFSEKELFFT